MTAAAVVVIERCPVDQRTRRRRVSRLAVVATEKRKGQHNGTKYKQVDIFFLHWSFPLLKKSTSCRRGTELLLCNSFIPLLYKT
jgi:hypothetical protein